MEIKRDLLPSFGIDVIKLEGFKDKERVYSLPVGNNQRVLVFGDLLFNLTKKPTDFIGSIITTVFGSIGPLKVTRLGKMLLVNNKKQAARGLIHLANLYYDDSTSKYIS